MPRVTFLPSGRSFEVVRGGSLLRAILRARLPLARSCRGTGVCGLCRVVVVEPQPATSALAPMGAIEASLAAREQPRPGERYACLARVLDDVTITTSYW